MIENEGGQDPVVDNQGEGNRQQKGEQDDDDGRQPGALDRREEKAQPTAKVDLAPGDDYPPQKGDGQGEDQFPNGVNGLVDQ